MDAAARRALLRWYRRNRRDLPWRRTSDPYAVWVSEMMLQQTRVDVAAPYYERWMARLPTLRSLAAADEETVLALWSGLGYYNRARRMSAAARAFPRGLPADAEGLLQVPGIGPYTAAAVASIAHGQAVACVDGNVERVVRRVAGGPLRDAARTAAVRRRIAGLAQEWLDPASPGDWNQAVMELGATVCLPQQPACRACPVASACASAETRAWSAPERQAAGRTASTAPRRRAPAAERVPTRRYQVAVVRDGRRTLLVRRGRGVLAGLWVPPMASRAVAQAVRAATGIEIAGLRRVGRVRHAFSHLAWDMQVYVGAPAGQARGVDARSPRPGRKGALATASRNAAGAFAWIADAQLDERAVPSATRKALRLAGVAC